VTLVLAKPLHGVVPRVVGLPVDRALARLDRAKLKGEVGEGSGGKVVAQAPHWGVAAAPGMRVTLSVGRHG
jgi:beta-lactam-binding protein with PASTA domain